MKYLNQAPRVLSCLSLVFGAGIANAQYPKFSGVAVRETVAKNSTGSGYVYQYAVENSASNELEVITFDIDQSGASSAEVAAQADWRGSFTVAYDNKTRYAHWGVTHFTKSRLSPGVTLAGFTIHGSTPPAIRRARFFPSVFRYIDQLADEREARGESLSYAEQDRIKQVLVSATDTVGPSADLGTYERFEAWIADSNRLPQLGWFSNGDLLARIRALQDEALSAARAQDGFTARGKLLEVVSLMQASTPADRTDEGYAIIFYNADFLSNAALYPCEPILTIDPPAATHALGQAHTVTGRVINRVDGQPAEGLRMGIRVESGPHNGLGNAVRTDAEGRVSFTYTGIMLGTDQLFFRPWNPGIVSGGRETAVSGKLPVRARKPKRTRSSMSVGASACGSDLSEAQFAGPVTAKWEGGPDLKIQRFSPALLKSAPGKTFYVNETTWNVGDLPAPASVTRYFLSATEEIDLDLAIPVGERQVRGLSAAEADGVEQVAMTVPTGAQPGLYYLTACADVEGSVIETNEDNNCSHNTLEATVGIVAVEPTGEPPPSNHPPKCDGAAAAPSALWPPNHSMALIAFSGVTDPDGDSITISATAIRQDEPVLSRGSGNFGPDGILSPPQVRAEREGGGNGRVYAIQFKAEDGKGGQCTGAVTVCVPHDQGQPPNCQNDGSRYDSTMK